MRKLHEITPESTLNDELWDMALPHRSDTIPKNDCIPGYLYWGEGNREGDLAICTELDSVGGLYFVGRRTIRDKYDLFKERHSEDVRTSSGGWAPIVRLDKTPEFTSDDETLDWLIDKEIEIVDTKIEWLKAIPARLKRATDYDYILETDNNYLEALKSLSRLGLTGVPMQPFAQMNKDRERRGLPTI